MCSLFNCLSQTTCFFVVPSLNLGQASTLRGRTVNPKHKLVDDSRISHSALARPGRNFLPDTIGNLFIHENVARVDHLVPRVLIISVQLRYQYLSRPSAGANSGTLEGIGHLTESIG